MVDRHYNLSCLSRRTSVETSIPVASLKDVFHSSSWSKTSGRHHVGIRHCRCIKYWHWAPHWYNINTIDRSGPERDLSPPSIPVIRCNTYYYGVGGREIKFPKDFQRNKRPCYTHIKAFWTRRHSCTSCTQYFAYFILTAKTSRI